MNIHSVIMARIVDMHKKWLKNPKHRKAYEAADEAFASRLKSKTWTLRC